MGAPITSTLGSVGTPYDYGAGEVSNIETLHPGLVYETGATDYLEFLCNYGYNLSTIKLIASKIPDGFSCPHNSSVDFISNMNYPSISISGLSGSKKVTRTVTNVGEEETVYVATLDVPAEMDVKVLPEKLHFSKKNKKLSYEVIFTSRASSPMKDTFGSITWSNGKNKVRSTIVVSKKSNKFEE